jgi:hypothetical protein
MIVLINCFVGSLNHTYMCSTDPVGGSEMNVLMGNDWSDEDGLWFYSPRSIAYVYVER